jgi:hypothetical protein
MTTTLVYEKIEDFLDKLTTMDKKHPVYVSVIHAKQNDMHVASIRMHFIDDDAVVNMFNDRENVKSVRMLPLEFFRLVVDEAIGLELKKGYDEELNDFNIAVKGDYDSAVENLKKLGYSKVVNAYFI